MHPPLVCKTTLADLSAQGRHPLHRDALCNLRIARTHAAYPWWCLKARRAMTHGRLIGGKQPRTAGAARQQDAHLYAPRNEIVVPFSSTDSETRKRSIENWFCLEHIPRRSRFCYRKTATVLLPFCGTIFYKMSQTSPYNCTPTCAGFAPVTCRVLRLAAAPLQEVAL